MSFCHAYSRKYSRLSILDAPLTLGRLYSLFSQSPVAKQHSVVLLGRLPTSLSSGKKERVNVSYNIVDRRSTKGANEKARGDCLGLFVGSPNWARTSDIMINSHALSHSMRFAPKKRPYNLCTKVQVTGDYSYSTAHYCSAIFNAMIIAHRKKFVNRFLTIFLHL